HRMPTRAHAATIAQSRPELFSLGPTLCLAMLATLLLITGCASFGKRTASDEKMLAARELCRLGQNAWESSRWGEAHARFARALELCPQHVESRRHYARAMWQ